MLAQKEERQFNFKLPTQNNHLALSTITTSEYAALSLDVYGGERPSLPPGWTRFYYREYPTHYAGACYIKNIADPTHVVFAHRGTQSSLLSPSSWQDLLADLDILGKSYPKGHFESLMMFFGEACEALLEKYPQKNWETVVFGSTGHSLGAVLSDMLGLLGNWYPSITFENPGSMRAIMAYCYEQNATEESINEVLSILSETCVTYLADMNIINTCSQPLGKTFAVLPKMYDFFYNSDKFGKPGPDVSYFYYGLNYSLEQHQMRGLYNSLRSGVIPKLTIYPLGLKNGYKAYLDPVVRYDYWHAYAKTVWEANIDTIKDKYNNFDEFFNVFINNLKRVHEQVSTMKGADFEKTSKHHPLSLSTTGFFAGSNEEKPELKPADFFLINKTQRAKSKDSDGSDDQQSSCLKIM